MKRIQYHRYGGPSEMRLEEFRLPPLRAGEILVRVEAASVNPFDWKVRSGTLRLMTGRTFPRAMGSDFSGVVEDIGPGVARLRVGDEVFGTARTRESGAFAPRLVTLESLTVRKPAGVPFEQAACLPIAGATAWRGLFEKANLQAGGRVFVNGCTGGVGQAVVRLAQRAGATIAGSCGAGSAAIAQEIGVTELLDYERDDPAALGAAFDVVFDTAGTLPVPSALAMLKATGVLLDINPTPGRLLRGVLSRRYRLVFGSQSVELLQKLASAADTGGLRFVLGRRAALGQAIDLITALEQGRRSPGRALIAPMTAE